MLRIPVDAAMRCLQKYSPQQVKMVLIFFFIHRNVVVGLHWTLILESFLAIFF